MLDEPHEVEAHRLGLDGEPGLRHEHLGVRAAGVTLVDQLQSHFHERFIASRKFSSLRNAGVLSSTRCDQRRWMPPSTVRH